MQIRLVVLVLAHHAAEVRASPHPTSTRATFVFTESWREGKGDGKGKGKGEKPKPSPRGDGKPPAKAPSKAYIAAASKVIKFCHTFLKTGKCDDENCPYPNMTMEALNEHQRAARAAAALEAAADK